MMWIYVILAGLMFYYIHSYISVQNTCYIVYGNISVFILSTVYSGLNPQLGPTKNYTKCSLFLLYMVSTQDYEVKANIDGFRVRILFPSGMACLSCVWRLLYSLCARGIRYSNSPQGRMETSTGTFACVWRLLHSLSVKFNVQQVLMNNGFLGVIIGVYGF